MIKEHVAYTVEKFLELAIEVDSLHDEHETLLYSPLHYSDKERRTKLDANVASRDKLEAKFGKMWNCLSGKQQLVVYGKLDERGLGYVADGI